MAKFRIHAQSVEEIEKHLQNIQHSATVALTNLQAQQWDALDMDLLTVKNEADLAEKEVQRIIYSG